ncbi:MAG: sigma 54-interacting transcriptional regulator [Myxococcota bacterium]
MAAPVQVSSAPFDERGLPVLTLPSGRMILLMTPEIEALYLRVQERIAPTEISLLIQGETGTGKELLARAAHESSPRRSGPFIAVNCATIPDTLAESELFGHAKGAFSGADVDRAGLIEAAHGGTLFLDEVGELSARAQAKLLRVLENGALRRLGESAERTADVRIISATHRPLDDEAKSGQFRRDLYYRLRGAIACLPPLRRAGARIPHLAEETLRYRAARLGRSDAPIFDQELCFALEHHPWPGNVRELIAFLDYTLAGHSVDVLPRAVFDEWIGTSEDRRSLQPRALTSLPARAPAPTPPLNAPARFRPIAEEIAELERDRMRAALRASHGHRGKAAALISMPIRTFGSKLRLYGLDRLDEDDQR